MNAPEILKLYDDACKLYGKQKMLVEDVRIFEPLYQQYSLAEMQAALNTYAENGKYFPKPVDLINIAKNARYDKAIEDQRRQAEQIRYVGGEPVYNCPYCQDSGYMEVCLPDKAYPSLMATCVHNKPNALARLRKEGRFHFKSRNVDEVLVWIPARRLFAPEGSCVPEWEQSHYSDSAKLTAAEDLTAAAVDLFGGKL